MNKRIYLSSPNMGGMELGFIEEAFNTNWIAPLGPNVNNFEKEVADYIGIKDAAAVVSGTSAIHLALKCVGVNAGDKIFCTSLTFAATCNPIIYENAIPVFIDSEPESWNMSPVALAKAFKDAEKEGQIPKAVIVVHLYGQCADMDKIRVICDYYNVPIIEDAAEALGASYKTNKAGILGDYGVFSFNGNKIITTSGGGMIVSNNEEMIKKSRFWATQSKEPALHYEHVELGYNYRMSNITAGIGRGQLRVLEERIKQKKHIYNTYKEGFMDIGHIEMMPICQYGEPNYWLSCMTLKEDLKVKPIDIIEALEKENIESRPIWKPMNLQPFYMGYKFYNHNDCGISVGEDIFNRGICLPSDTKMSNDDIDRVIDIVKEVIYLKNKITICSA